MYGFTQFEMPQIVNAAEPSTVFVSYEVVGVDPSEGSVADVFVEVDFPSNVQYKILDVRVRPDNAFMVIYSASPETALLQKVPSVIFVLPHNDSRGHQVWWGLTLVEFGAAGPFGSTVDVTAIPSPEYSNATKQDYQTTMQFHDQMATITIGPRGIAQQRLYEDQNLSLTLFILFFASVDIAVTLYDHCYEVVTTNKNGTSQQKPKKGKGGLTEKTIRAIIKWVKGGERQDQPNRHGSQSNQNQRKKGQGFSIKLETTKRKTKPSRKSA
jgi:hypothetical protein